MERKGGSQYGSPCWVPTHTRNCPLFPACFSSPPLNMLSAQYPSLSTDYENEALPGGINTPVPSQTGHKYQKAAQSLLKSKALHHHSQLLLFWPGARRP